MATAVSFRHGSSTEHANWKGGVQAEITVDTSNHTVWVHDGEPESSGVPLARADLYNVSAQTIVNQGQVLKRDMTNFQYGGKSIHNNIDNEGNNPELGQSLTKYLKLYDSLEEYIESKYNLGWSDIANKNMSNVDTTNLATTGYGHAGKNLAYADLGNVTNATLNDKNILLRDLSNITSDGTSKLNNLVDFSNYATLNYVQEQIADVSTDFSSYQKTSQKDASINKATADSTHYPSTVAVVNYIDNTFKNDFVKADLSNVSSWAMATSTIPIYSFFVQVSNGNSGYSYGDEIITDFEVPDPDDPSITDYLTLIVTEVNGSIIQSVVPDPVYSATEITTPHTYTDSKGTIFKISTNPAGQPGGLITAEDVANNYAAKSTVSSHISNRSNPHGVTKAQVGLGNVDNTSDANKPISTATQTALNAKANSADLATVATSGSYNDLSNKPALKTVATSGSYNDLTNKPTIPTVTSTYTAGNSTNALSAAAVDSKNFVSGEVGSSGTRPTNIAIYNTDAEALAASQAHPTWVCFSLGK